jgi:hypothetical protein
MTDKKGGVRRNSGKNALLFKGKSESEMREKRRGYQ